MQCMSGIQQNHANRMTGVKTLHYVAGGNNSSQLKNSDCHEDSTCLLALRDNIGDKFPWFFVAHRATLLV